MTPSTKLRRAIVVLLAGGSLAVGVPAALAATGGNDTAAGAGGGQTLEQFIQDQQGTPHRGDCPERDGSQGGSGAPDASTDPAPSV